MKKVSYRQQGNLQLQAKKMAADIASLMTQYTDDSALAKFFLPQEPSRAIHVTGAAFSAVIYDPTLEDFEEIRELPSSGMFYMAITFGVHIYLKEHSIKFKSSPFNFITDEVKIEKARKKIMNQAGKAEMKSTPFADMVIKIFLRSFMQTFKENEFKIENHAFQKEKFLKLIGTSLYWGYNFAEEVIVKKK